MPTRRVRLRLPRSTPAEQIRAAFARLRTEMEIPAGFPPDVLAEAEDAAARPSRDHPRGTLDVQLVTIDPPGSMDLDQAVHVARTDDGFEVTYAIADVAQVVDPGGAVDREARTRGVTFYGPDSRVPLHPPVLSEGAASLLPDVERPAAVWRILLDASGEITAATVARGLVRSRARFTYAEAQQALDDGTADASLVALRDVGRLREALERHRGGASLDLPEQDVTVHEDGTYGLALRSVLPVEGWNAQISLLTGIAAARIMRAGGMGILRTLPRSDPRDVERLRRAAHALGIEWPQDVPYGELLAGLESSVPRHAAFLDEATSLFRGAGYLAFEGEVPDDAEHAAIAAEYAHVTAPLRRLVDRFATEICLTLSAGGTAADVPGWVRDAFDELPRTMQRCGQRASAFERASVDIVEAALLADRVGEELTGVVVDRDAKNPQRGQVVITEPAARGTVTAGVDLPLGEAVTVRLVEASVADRRIAFTYEG